MDPRIVRSQVIAAIRDHFHGQGFIETDTASLVLSPGMEPHIRPIRVAGSSAFLPTSPEFAMKRLLAQGYERIFQLCKAYRLEPKSVTHNPEFTILEWYRGHSSFEAIMDDVEAMFVAIAQAIYKAPRFETLGYGVQDVSRPWERITIEDCFRRFAGRDSVPNDEDTFFRIMLNEVEPRLAKLGRPVILYNYPEAQAALSNVFTDARGLRWAKRFEVYAGGLELGNAFDELIDVREQRRRFEKDMALREKLYGADFPANPIDEEFLKALEKMPPSGGIAMGVDRIAMYFAGATDIKDVLWVPSYWPES